MFEDKEEIVKKEEETKETKPAVVEKKADEPEVIEKKTKAINPDDVIDVKEGEEEIGFKDVDDFIKQTLSDPKMSKLMMDGRIYTMNKKLSRYDKDPSIDKIFKNFDVQDERIINFGNSLEKDGKIIYNYNSGKIFKKKENN